MPDKQAVIRIQVFGGLQIQLKGTALDLEKHGGSKPLELLKFLIAYGGHNVSVDFVASKLWPASDGDNARGAFNGTLLRLRKIIGVPEALTLKGGMLSLNAKLCWLDAWVFDDLTQKIQNSIHQKTLLPDTASVYSHNLLSLFQGPCFGSESDFPWIYFMQDKTKTKFTRTVLALGNYLTTHGKPDEAAMLFEHALEYYPLSEEICLKLMDARVAQGLSTESLLAYRRFEHMLKETMGMVPSGVLLQKMKAIKDQ